MADLKQEKSSFRLVGCVAPITKNSLQPAKLNKKNTWHTVNTTLGIDIDGQGNIVYARLFGGHSSQGKPIYVRPAKVNEGEEYKMLEIPLQDRNNQELYDEISNQDIYTTDVSGTKQQFISMVDFVNHLRENIVEGMEVIVYGNVEYSVSDVNDMDKVYRNYNVNSVLLNKQVEDKETGETKLSVEHGTRLIQTYLLTNYSLPSDWKSQLKKEKEVIITGFVPQYIGTVKDKHSGSYIPYKHTVAIPQSIVARLESTPEKTLKLLDNLFKVKGDDSIRKINLHVRINEGYTQSTGEINVSPELQKLIDSGLLSLDEVEQQVTVRGPRTRELILETVSVTYDRDTAVVSPYDDEMYQYDVLQVPKPKVDADQDFNTISDKKESKSDDNISIDDDIFEDEFTESDNQADNFLDGLFD